MTDEITLVFRGGRWDGLEIPVPRRRWAFSWRYVSLSRRVDKKGVPDMNISEDRLRFEDSDIYTLGIMHTKEGRVIYWRESDPIRIP